MNAKEQGPGNGWTAQIYCKDRNISPIKKITGGKTASTREYVCARAYVFVLSEILSDVNEATQYCLLEMLRESAAVNITMIKLRLAHHLCVKKCFHVIMIIVIMNDNNNGATSVYCAPGTFLSLLLTLTTMIIC